jgi:hypothetical protein
MGKGQVGIESIPYGCKCMHRIDHSEIRYASTSFFIDQHLRGTRSNLYARTMLQDFYELAPNLDHERVLLNLTEQEHIRGKIDQGFEKLRELCS